MELGEGPRIEAFFLGESDLEAYYTTWPYSAMAIQSDALPIVWRAREIEAYGHHIRPPRSGRKMCFVNDTLEKIDKISVRALRRVVDDMAPEWVSEVREATRMFNRADLIAGWCEIPLQATTAILENLRSRNELPDQRQE